MAENNTTVETTETNSTTPKVESVEQPAPVTKPKPSKKHIIVYDDSLDMTKKITQNIEGISLVKEAIEHNQIVPYFQPIYNLKTNKIEKYECLARIIKDNSSIAPYMFMDIAIKSKLYPEITKNIVTKSYKDFTLKLIRVNHSIVPALALAIEVDSKKIVISGDTSNKNHNLEKITKDADLFIAHHAIPEHSGAFSKKLHMTPSTIAKIALKSKVKKVILTHRMRRTLDREQESLKIIKNIYKGEVEFAEDRMRVPIIAQTLWNQ